MGDEGGGDDLRNPGLNPPETPAEVAAEVDPAQGFEIEEPLPGQLDEDEGYERALAGEEEAESEADAEQLDALDDESGVGQGYTLGQQNVELLREVEDEETPGEGG